MNADELKKVLQDELGLDADALNKLETNKMLREPVLTAATTEMLTGIGLVLGDALAIKAKYPCPAPAVAASAAPNADLTKLVEAIVAGNQNQANALQALLSQQINANSIICGNCGGALPVDTEVDLCPYCGNDLRTTTSECGLCGTKVPKGVNGAKKCTNPDCNADLLDGEDLEAAKYLVDVQGVSPIDVGEKVRNADAPTRKKWSRQGKKVDGYPVHTHKQGAQNVQEYSDAAKRRYVSLTLERSTGW